MTAKDKKGGGGGKDEGEEVSYIQYLLNCVIIDIIALVVDKKGGSGGKDEGGGGGKDEGGGGGKDEGEEGSNIRYLLNCVIIGIIALVVLILFTILIIFLVLRPTKPKFWLQDVTVYNFTLSKDQGHYLTTTMQVTLSSYNPNRRISVSYDELEVFVEYRQQQVTIPTAINNVYQGKKDVNVWSPFLYGVDVPIAEYMCVDMAHDKIAGLVLVHIRVSGRVRWKVGTWMSGHYHIRVTCPAFLTVRENDPHSDTNGDSFKFQQITRCTVDV